MKFLADKNMALHDAKSSKKLGDLMVPISRFDNVPDPADEPPPHDTIVVNANKYARVHSRSLVDGGANGSLFGAYMKLIAPMHRTVSIFGIDHHLVNDKSVGTFIGVAQSHLGRVLLCMNEYAGVPTQKTYVLSKVQMTDYGCKVGDTSILHGGKQVLKSKCGHFFPL